MQYSARLAVEVITSVTLETKNNNKKVTHFAKHSIHSSTPFGLLNQHYSTCVCPIKHGISASHFSLFSVQD